LVARLEESQGLTQAPVPESAEYHPDPALPETRGDDEDHAKPADTMLDLAVPPHEISDSNKPAISEDIIPSEVAAEHHPEQAAAKHPAPLDQTTSTKEEGVGHVMVEGTEEESAAQASIQPAALDPEVAKVVAEEEMKDDIPTPEPEPEPEPTTTTATTGMEEKHVSESRVHTPDLDNDEDIMDSGEEVETRKRMRDEDMEKAPKRPKRQFRSLPSDLSHLIHPPTTCLYISNLRRPLLLSALHEHLTPSLHQSPLLPPSKGPFSNPEYPNVWLSGIKSHAYSVYDTVESAIEVAIRINGKIFPEDTGGELKVDFVDEDEITRLVQKEESAWLGGRQKLELKISKHEEGYKFELIGGVTGNGNSNGSGRPMNGRGSAAPPPPGRRQAPVAVPLTGINAMPVGPRSQQGPSGTGSGPSRFGQGRGEGSSGPQSRLNQEGGGGRYTPGGQGQGQGQGRDVRGLPPHLDRQGGGGGFRPGPGGFSDDRAGRGRGGGGFERGEGERRTKVKPELSWNEGPRAR